METHKPDAGVTYSCPYWYVPGMMSHSKSDVPEVSRTIHEVHCEKRAETCSICGHPLESDYLAHIARFHDLTFALVDEKETEKEEGKAPSEPQNGGGDPREEEKVPQYTSSCKLKPLACKEAQVWVTSGACERCGAVIDFDEYVSHMRTHEIENVTPGGPDDRPTKPEDLPRVIYTGKGVDKACQICLMDYQQGEILVYLPCVHRFHEECLMKWLAQKDKCPVCTRNIYGEISQYSNASGHVDHSGGMSGGELALRILVGLLIIAGEILL